MTTTAQKTPPSSLANISHEMDAVKRRMHTLEHDADSYYVRMENRSDTFRQRLTALKIEADHNAKVAHVALWFSIAALLVLPCLWLLEAL